MAGRVRINALGAELERRTRDAFELNHAEPCLPYLDYVAAWIEDGRTVKELAKDITDSAIGFEVTYAFLMRYLRERWTETDQRLEEARVRASHSIAETSIELVDAPAYTTVEVSRAASRARARQWIAERYNPKAFGSQKGASVTVSIGSLHLAALQHSTTIVTGSQLTDGQGESTRALPVQVVDSQQDR